MSQISQIATYSTLGTCMLVAGIVLSALAAVFFIKNEAYKDMFLRTRQKRALGTGKKTAESASDGDVVVTVDETELLIDDDRNAEETEILDETALLDEGANVKRGGFMVKNTVAYIAGNTKGEDGQ